MKKQILFFLLFACTVALEAQSVKLFSGTADPNNPGCDVGGSAVGRTIATWGNPWGIAVDTNGNIWVTENLNHRVRMITSDFQYVYSRAGDASCPASGGYTNAAGSQARFYGPTGITVGKDNNIYVCDALNNVIRKISPYVNAGNAQSVTLLAGDNSASGYADGTGAAAKFDYPNDVAVDASGNVYVADLNNNCIRKITSAGVVTTFAGTNTAGYKDGDASTARFDKPWGLCWDNNGDLLVADYGNYRIRRVNVKTSPAGSVSTVAGNGQQTVKDGRFDSCSFNSVYDLICDKNGNIYIAEGDQSHVVRKISTSGQVTTLAGEFNNADTLNGTFKNARFNTITGIALTKDGKNLIVCDELNNTLRILDISSMSVDVDFTADKTNIKVGDIVAFTNTTTVTTGTTYNWTITPGTAGTDFSYTSGTATSKDISVKFLKPGNYTIEMAATNSSFGTLKSTKNAMIKVTTGIGYIPLTGISIYPNPSKNGIIYIESNDNKIDQVRITDLSGREVYNMLLKGESRIHVPTQNFESGIYMIQLRSGDRTLNTRISVQ